MCQNIYFIFLIIGKLFSVFRLSLPLPQHLSQLPQPSNNEVTLANQITMNLTNMAKKVNPSDVAPVQSLRKAMGVGEKIQTSMLIL